MFPPYSEKILRKRVAKVAWCPTSDLAAIVFDDSSIALCRDGVSPIWSLPAPNDSNVLALAWNPQGNEFVVGSADGTVTRIDARSYEPKCTTCWPSALKTLDNNFGDSSITALCWVNFSRHKAQEMYLHGFDPSVLDFTQVLPALSMEPPDEPIPLIPTQRIKKPPFPEPPMDDMDDQTLLLIGDEEGYIHICLNGTYHIGSFSTRSKGSKDAFSLATIDACADVSELQTLSYRKTAAVNEVSFSTLQCDLLRCRRTELCNLATEHGHVLFLLQYIRQTINVLAKHHTTVTSLSKQNATKISDLLLSRNEQTLPMPEIELLGLIATGNPCEAVYEYFTQLLSEQQLKRWGERATHSYSCSQMIVCEYLQPACERLLLHLDTLYGYSLWTERYNGLLDPEAVELCMRRTKKLMQSLTRYLADVTKESVTFSEFIKWMSNMFYKFVGEGGTEAEVIPYDPWRAVEHIRNSFASDRLAPYFTASSTAPAQEMNFSDMVGSVSDACRAMLEQPSITLSANITVTESQTLELDCTRDDTPIGRFAASWMDEDQAKQHFALKQRNEALGDKVILIKKDLKGVEPAGYASLEFGSCHISDLEFLDAEEIALVSAYPTQETLLSTIEYNAMEYVPFQAQHARIEELQECQFSRSMELEKTKDAVIGANGRPRRRTIGVYRANRKASSYFLDE
ncbi:predicted protein [Lichtheimia corymbifera JMRC:FSU:9682]|uniref:Anaphase-promoting complex subunit 4 n=1 Tax=Lichtheimia corymbifera JMRC:FSU:9682 TaxID=1263082 RepID=A0A068RGB4_9FUNG|nr:predicted protein [Lichtheimia corymbifera JMRC:FSU:9682]